MCAFRLYVWRYVRSMLYIPQRLYFLIIFICWQEMVKETDNAIRSGSLHTENYAPLVRAPQEK